MRILARIVFFVLSLASAAQCFGQAEKPFTQFDTIRTRRNVQVILLPVVFYTPETQFGLGVGTQLFFKKLVDQPSARESSLLVTAIYTTEKQFIFEAQPKIYLAGGKRYIDGLFRYKVFPNSFWGIGNTTPESNLEQYNMRTIQFRVDLLERTLDDQIRFGAEYFYDRHIMLDRASGGILEEGAVPGAEGATLTGLGLIFNLDSRDNIFSAYSGWYLQFKGIFSSKLFGATHSYNQFEIDVRKYFTIREKHVLAGQVYSIANLGGVPFQNMAWFGGGERGRGYFRGRFMDRMMYSFQIEYRYKFARRFSAAAFFSAGEVASEFRGFFSVLHPSAGGGIRFQLRKDNPTLLRLDYGIGTEGNSGIYFGVNEAF